MSVWITCTLPSNRHPVGTAGLPRVILVMMGSCREVNS